MVPPLISTARHGARTVLNPCPRSEWQADFHHLASSLDLRNKDTEAQRGEGGQAVRFSLLLLLQLRCLEEDIQYTRYHLYHHRFLTTYWSAKAFTHPFIQPLLTYVYWPSASCLFLYEKLKIMPQMQPTSHLWYLIVKPKCHGTGKKKMHQCILKLSQMESLENFKRKRERVGQGGVPRAPEGFLYRRPVSELPWDMQPAFFSLPELDIRSRWELQEGLNRMSELEMTLRVIHLGLHFIEGVEVGDSSPQLGSHGPGIYHNLRRSALPSQASWFQGRPFMSFLSCSLAQLQRLKRNYLFCLQIQHWTLGRGDREMVSFVCLCVSVCLSFTNTLRPGQEQP